MREPPGLSRFVSFPVVGGLAVLSAAVPVADWTGAVDVSPLLEDPNIRRGQVWRLVTSILPHVDIVHLAFNLYWLWALGSLVEETFGHARTLALVLALAVGSSAAEYALFYGGVGLSGVGYGLFGFLWVLSRRDERFRDAVDAQTAALFVGWFFLCIAATYAGVWEVANLAHGVGAVLGALLGLAVSSPPLPRLAYGALTACLVAAFAAGVYARPYVNLTEERAWERGQLGYTELLEGNDEAAARHLRAALAIRDDSAPDWFNLGIALQRLGREAEARQAFQRAAELEPANADYRSAFEQIAPAAPTGDR